jgi:hypothetical protein
MLRGDFDHRVEAQPVELERASAGAAIVRLVDGDDDGRVGGVDGAGDLLVGWHQPFATIYYEDNDIRRLERFVAPLDDELVKRILARAEQPARVHERERGAAPVGRVG